MADSKDTDDDILTLVQCLRAVSHRAGVYERVLRELQVILTKEGRTDLVEKIQYAYRDAC